MSFLNKLCLILLFGVYCEAQMPTRKEAYMTVKKWKRMQNERMTKRLEIFKPSIVKAAGYPVEKHRVTTPDGYILLMHRIPGGRRSANQTGELNAKRKKAILILHGLSGCSSNFVLLGPKRSLGYFLADAGYDVWLANVRGTLHTKHTKLTQNDKEFWECSFHEQGKYDVPAMIDRILEVTGLEKIMCLGHSLGTTIFFAMMGQRPEYNDKLIAFVALAPSVYADYLKDIANMSLNILQLPKLAKAIGWRAIMPQVIHFLQANICNMEQPDTDICSIILHALFGEDIAQYDSDMAPTYLYRIQPFPVTSLEHYAKVAMTGVFTTFSGGVNGPIIPYNISNVKIPVSLLYGGNDRLSHLSDIHRLKKQLQANGVLEDVGPATWHEFNHIDFIFAKDVATLLNKPLVKHIDHLYNKYGPV